MSPTALIFCFAILIPWKHSTKNIFQFWKNWVLFFVFLYFLIGVTGKTNLVDLTKGLPPITFITATSESHAGEARNLTLRLAKDHPTWRLVLYDIGLEKQTRKWFEVSPTFKMNFFLQAACNLDVRDINLTHYGVELDNYRWKPIVIAVCHLVLSSIGKIFRKLSKNSLQSCIWTPLPIGFLSFPRKNC